MMSDIHTVWCYYTRGMLFTTFGGHVSRRVCGGRDEGGGGDSGGHVVGVRMRIRKHS